MIVASHFLPAVAANLLEYFHLRLGICTDYAEGPVQVTDGWETYIYRFRVSPRPGLPAEFARPLVLRLYSMPEVCRGCGMSSPPSSACRN